MITTLTQLTPSHALIPACSTGRDWVLTAIKIGIVVKKLEGLSRGTTLARHALQERSMSRKYPTWAKRSLILA